MERKERNKHSTMASKTQGKNNITLNVLNYNIMTPVPEPIRFYGQNERAERVKDVIRELDQQYDLDVIILNEVVSIPSQKIIFRDMPTVGFPYHTSKLTEVLSVTGGVLLFSKHPITQQESSTFGDNCTGIDCFAAKGVIYARIKKQGHYFNVMGTHMQAWPSISSQIVRDAQIDQISKFIQSFNLPRTEPLIFGGDLNIDLFMNNDHIRHLMHVLHMNIPEIHEDSHPMTVDPQANQLVGNDDPPEYISEEWPQGCAEQYYETLQCPCCPAEWIDYMLFSKDHLQPSSSYMKAIPHKVKPFRMKINHTKTVDNFQDVSDHFPLLGHFVFDLEPAPEKGQENRDLVNRDSDSLTSSNRVASVVIIAVMGVVLLIVLLGVAVYRYLNPFVYKDTPLSLALLAGRRNPPSYADEIEE